MHGQIHTCILTALTEKGVAALSALFAHFWPRFTVPTPPRLSLKRLTLIQQNPLRASSMLIRAKHNIRFPPALQCVEKGLKACMYMRMATVCLFV